MNNQKLLYLLSEFGQNSFKEKRLAFDKPGETPKPAETSSARPAEAAERAKERAQEERLKLGEAIAALLVPETTNKDLKKLADDIKSDKVDISSATPAEISNLLGLLKEDQNLLRKFFASSIETIQNLIIAAKEDRDLLQQTFDYVDKTGSMRNISDLSVIQILMEKLGKDTIVARLTTRQKGDILNVTGDSFSQDLKIELFNSILNEVSGDFAKLLDDVINHMANFSITVAADKPQYINTVTSNIIISEKLNSLTENTLVKFVEALAEGEKTQESYAKIIEKLKLDENKKILFANTLIQKIKTDLGIPEAPVAAETATAAAAEAPAETSEFNANITPEQMIEKAGLKIIPKGKKESVGWDFTIDLGEGKTAISERSFIKTKKFLKELTKKDKTGKLIYNTPDKVKLCAYKWLLTEIYEKKKITTNKYKVAEFEKSQAMLQSEIEGLKAKFEPTAAATAEPAVQAPAVAAQAAPAPAEGAAPAAPAAAIKPAAAPAEPTAAAPDAHAHVHAEAPAPATTAAPTEPQAPKKREESEKKMDAMNVRIVKKLEELQILANTAATEQTDPQSPEPRTIKITTESKILRNGQVHEIKIDGKKSPFILTVIRDIRAETTEFAFSKIGAKPLLHFKEHSEAEVQKAFEDMLLEIPNERQVKNFDEAVGELQVAGIDTTEPKTLTVEQYSTLKTVLPEMQTAIKDGKNAITILKKLKQLATECQPVMAGSSIEKITLKTTPQIVWEPKNGESPFGSEESLINTILAIKRAELKPEDYDKFYELSRTRKIETVSELDEQAKIAEYRSKYKELTEKTFSLRIGDASNLANISEEEIVKNWKKMNGFKKVEAIMTKPPWSLHKERVSKEAAAIISEWNNSEVNFEDVFKSIKEIPAFTEKGLDSLLKKGANGFMETFDKLLKDREAGNLPEEHMQKQLDLMFTEVIVPCLELIDAFTHLENPKETEKKKKEELPEDQREILEALSKLCGVEEDKLEIGGWSDFIASLSGGKDKITMSDIDGKTFAISKGAFKDHYSPKAALTIMTNIPDRYHSENRVQIFNKETMLEEINDRIKLGVINMVMYENKTLNLGGTALSTLINHKLGNMLVTDLKKITPDQIKAFQLGFILKEARQFAERVANAKQAVTESFEDPIIQNHPLFKALASKLLDQGVPPEKVKKIQEKLLLAAGASFKNGKFEGGGIGVPINLGDGFSLMIGLGATTKGDVIAGLGLNVQVYEGETLKAGFSAGIDTAGAIFGADQTIKTEYPNIHVFEGLRWSWNSIVPTVGGGFGLSWNMEAQLKRDLEAAEGKTDYAKLWEEWKKMPESDIDGKFEALKQIPQIWRPFEQLMTEFGLTKADVINMINGIKDQITEEVIKDLHSPIPFFSYGGFGMLGPIPIPHVGIKMGSVVVSTPNRKAIAKILEELSDIRVTQALKKAVEEIDKGKKITVFTERTGKLVYGRDGQLLSLLQSNQIDLKDWQTSLDVYSSQLERMEMGLKQNDNGTIELQIDGTSRKDVEIHIDPTLTDLALIKDGSKILIEGNIDDLIISRERFSLPFEVTKGSASMRDVITIRQRASLQGDRDATWIQRFESAFFQKLEDEETFDIMAGNRPTPPQRNILKIDGYASKSAEALKQTDIVKDLIAKRPDLAAKLDQSEIKAFEEKLKRRHEALKKSGSAMETTKYKELEQRAYLFKDLNELWDNEAFRKEFRTKIDDPEALVQILTKHADKTETLKNLNEKEINLGIIHLINLHFTNVYAESTKGKNLNTEVLKHMEAKIKFVRNKVLIPTFENTIKTMDPKPTFSAENLVDKLISDTYDPLRAKLNSKDFDFSQIKVENIPAGAYLFSGSRLYNEQGKIEGAPATHISYETLPKAEELLLGFGFLEGTTGDYSLQSTDAKEENLARVLLEISSPIEAEDSEFLDSPLALRFAGLATGVLLSYNDATGFDDYDKITEIYEDRSILKSSQPHKEALDRYKKFIEEVRDSQINGTTIERKIGKTGLTVRITMSTDITRGAYSKCTNPSFAVQEAGEVEVINESGKIIAKFNMTNEVIDTELSKIFASVGLGVAFREEAKAPTPEEQPESEQPTATPGGSTGGGTGGETHGGAGQEVITPQDTPAANAGE